MNQRNERVFSNLPALSSFCRGALASEYSIIVSINPIALAARLLSGPGCHGEKHKTIVKTQQSYPVTEIIN